MLKLFFKFSFRNLLRNKSYSILNILGLTLGLGASIIIFLYVNHERSYDKFHEDADRIYRVNFSFKSGSGYTKTTTSAYRIGPLLHDNIPAIDSYLRLYYAFNNKKDILYGDKVFNITDNYTYTDPNFFTFFSFKLLSGDPASVLREPNSVVITRSLAETIFGQANPTGKQLTIRNVYDNSETSLKVTGVMEDIPSNSHIPYEVFISLNTIASPGDQMTTSWGWTSQNNYIKLKEGVSITKVDKNLEPVMKSNAPEWFNEWSYLTTQSLLDIHLEENLKEELKPGGNEAYVNMLSYIAFFVLLIAGINYMNLATSMASKRFHEVGIKKAIGADRFHLTTQFLFEALLLISFSMILSLTLIQLFIPFFNDFVEIQLDLLALPAEYLLIGIGLIYLFGVLSGLYPALFISSFNPLNAISGNKYKFGRNTIIFRKGLVIVQFAISSFLICATLVILNQWSYLRKRALGMDTEQIMSISLSSKSSMENYKVLREELTKYPEIDNVGTSSKSPTGRYDGFGTFFHNTEKYNFPTESLDAEFFDVMNIPLHEGRFFHKTPSDSNAVILNKTAVERLGIKNPIGKTIKFYDTPLKIVGVVEDFHFEPLYAKLGPLVIFRPQNGSAYAYLKYDIRNTDQVTNILHNEWQNVNPDQPLEYSFVNSEIQRAYRSEQQFFWVFILFSAFAIIIACLGLFGLVSFTITQRIKEIGIRKTLGASTRSITVLLSGNFMKLILIACMISWPLIYYVMDKWLQKFPYRIDLGFSIFFAGMILLFFISIVIVGSHSVRASHLDPVKTLRYE